MNQQPTQMLPPVETLEQPVRSSQTSRSVPVGKSPSAELDQALARARTRIAPLWPLKSFVAVNPFLGSSGERFEEACVTMKHVTGADLLMPRRYYRQLIAQGRITEDDLGEALAGARSVPHAPATLADLHSALEREGASASAVFVTVADVADEVPHLRTGPRAVEEISKWCAAYWDEGQAAWRMPWRHLPLYRAWRAAMAIDRTPEMMGMTGFREVIAKLPESPVATIHAVLDRLGLPKQTWDGYVHRALYSIRGWAAYARYLGWHREIEGLEDDTVIELLAARLAWDYALCVVHEGTALTELWRDAVAAMRQAVDAPGPDADVVVDAVLQGAADAACRRELLDAIEQASEATVPSISQKPLQAAFCIDVRSEVYRRALESVAPEAQTIGFAGFFGFPIEYVPIGQSHGPAQCPVLLSPKFVVRETVTGADADEITEILGLRLLRRRAANAWKSFKSSAVSSFVYVETAGLAFAVKLVSDATGMTRTVTDPSADGLDAKVVDRLAPETRPGTLGGRNTGMTASAQLDTAETVLRAMSLTDDFARLVLLAGHGSTMVNNPHASGYDCGACGGNPGDANARLAASILNDPEVRAGLSQRGILIPEQTWFVGGLHDTTTDEVTVFDRDDVPDSHQSDLERLDGWLREASKLARAERSALLRLGSENVDDEIFRRSRDWSQVRPEWGLARNSAFIAARRERTRGVDLNGRAFLHDYDWRKDEDWSVLELILTAPMVVASWINLQYYGSSVDREAFGSGNKVLHNVVGTLGVFEGNGGDLRVGLPWQAVHDGHRLVHEPLRLNVLIEAPTVQIDRILDKHSNVRELADHGWIHLMALSDDGNVHMRDSTSGAWITLRRWAS